MSMTGWSPLARLSSCRCGASVGVMVVVWPGKEVVVLDVVVVVVVSPV